MQKGADFVKYYGNNKEEVFTEKLCKYNVR